MKFAVIPGKSGRSSAVGCVGLLVAALAAGCAGRKSTIASGPPPAAPADSTAARTDLRAQADALWAHRGQGDTARLALEAYLKASAGASDPALLARLSRAYYLVANYVETDAARKDSLFLKGVEAAEKGLALHPGFLKVFRETQDEKKAVQELGPESIESLYWYSANLGKWASTKSLMVRLGNKGKLEAYNKRVMDLDERFFHGAPHRFFGALPTKVPGGDLNVSRKHFEKAIEIEPNYFGTRTLYAELYATKARDRATFDRQLDYVIATPASSLPDAEPENRYEQELAKKLKEQANDLFD